jgi:hypothetical protein
MHYYQRVLKSRRSGLNSLNDEALYDIANGYYDFEHGAGYYSRTYLIQMILNYEYKTPIKDSI